MLLFITLGLVFVFGILLLILLLLTLLLVFGGRLLGLLLLFGGGRLLPPVGLLLTLLLVLLVAGKVDGWGIPNKLGLVDCLDANMVSLLYILVVGLGWGWSMLLLGVDINAFTVLYTFLFRIRSTHWLATS